MRTDTFRIHTGNRPAVIDLSDRCARFVTNESGGLLTVFVPHATAGVAEWEPDESPTELIERADRALRYAKHRGERGSAQRS